MDLGWIRLYYSAMEFTEMNFASFFSHKVIQVKSHSFYCTIKLIYKYSLPTSKPMAKNLSLDKFEMLTYIYVSLKLGFCMHVLVGSTGLQEFLFGGFHF